MTIDPRQENYRDWAVDESAWRIGCSECRHDSFRQSYGHAEVTAGLSEPIAQVLHVRLGTRSYCKGPLSTYSTLRISTHSMLALARSRKGPKIRRCCESGKWLGPYLGRRWRKGL